jgi:DNA-binding CsgD family transcriptional regulator/PAS domain-containing protein
MPTTPQHLRSRLVELACSGHDFPDFAQRAIELLDSTVPLDAWCVMTADPITLLITGAVGENLPTSDPDNAAEFFRIEYSGEDFINFSDLARTGTNVGILSEATGGDLGKSPRWRALFGPAGLGDQLRIVCADGSACWGYLALHRTKDSLNFTRSEAKLASGVSRQLAEGIRLSLLVENADEENAPEGPGLILLDDDLTVVGVNSAAQRLLDQVLLDPEVERVVPSAIFSVAALVRGLENRGEVAETPKARIKGGSGRWLMAHATRLDSPDSERKIAVIVEPAPPLEAGAIALRAYGLTPRELEVAGLVLQGFSTAEIAAQLVVSELTVQQHLKGVFDKAAVRSRRELVSEVFRSQYWSRMMEGTKPSPSGWFVDSRPGQSD